MKPYHSYLSCRSSACTILQKSSKRTKQRPLWIICTGLKHNVCWFQTLYFSTSSRETYKAEAPIGIYSEKSRNLQMHLLQMQIKDSFKHLSHHINVYFRRKAVPTVSGQTVFSPAQQRHLGQNLEKRAVLKDEATEKFKHVHESYVGQSEKSRLSIMYPEVQLFHMSSLMTRFGENYSYVAGHINSVFSKCLRNQASGEEPSSEDVLKQSRTKTQRVYKHEPTSKNTGSSHYNAALHNKDDCCSWEEGYLHFARHINRYFGAKVADPAIASPPDIKPQSYYRRHKHIAPSNGPPVLRSEALDLHPLRPKSLFHLSNLSTQFGENYAYMSSHINRYFKGSADTDEEMERDPYRGQAEYKTLKKPVSFIQHIFNSLPIQRLDGSSLSTFTKTVPATDNVFDKVAIRQQLAEETTRVLLDKLAKVRSRSAISSCIEELNSHLILHPACKTVVWQKKAAMNILKHRHNSHTDQKLQAAIRETLALIGYVDPLKSCGIRVLSIDGGGTRGIVPLQVLKQLEVRTGKRVYQLFDYVCGVSTGAILAFMLALTHISLEECEEMYKRFGSDVFRQNPFVGTMKMGWTHSYYSTETWEMILKEKLGDQLLIRTARDEQSPKVSAVSAVVNWGTSPKPFIFRNYNHSPGRLSRYAGGSGYQLWQAVRASSAAPGYFQEFPLYNDIHQDGGIILNNPCALAVHKSRLLWANQPFQCVLSLGTGRYDNARRGPATSTSLRAKISNLISSATDTEGVHTLLADLLEPNVYFRFNPMLRADVSLDESRPQALQQLQEDTQRYLESNEPKLKVLCSVLGEERSKLWKTRDWISEKAWKLQQRWT